MTSRGDPAEEVGVLGGTFDPVHLGHLSAAREVRRVFSLRRVLLLPCSSPPHKRPAAVASVDHRLAMLRLAADGESGLELCTLEVERGGTSYTVETLDSLRRTGRLEPLFILGMDSLAELPTWREFRRIIREYDLIVVDRPGRDLAGALEGLGSDGADRVVPVPRVAGAGAAASGRSLRGGRIFHLPIPPVGVSSSQVRARAAAGDALDGLVPPAVARYIQSWGLYRQEAHR